MTALRHHQASATPAAPPAVAMSRLSVKSWRISRVRFAPMARRTPISRCRASPRATSKPARLAHAITKTKPTMLIKTNRGSRAPSCKTNRPCAPLMSDSGFEMNRFKSSPESLSSLASDSRIG